MKSKKKQTKVLHPEVLPAEAPARKRPARVPPSISHEDLSEELSEDSAEREQEEPEGSEHEEGRNPPETEIAPLELTDSDLKAVSVADPLRRYLEEVRRYPLLDAQKELELALRLRETGDLDAAKALVTANLRLVVKIAFEYRSFYSNVLDLIQEGNVGLMKAVSKYDPAQGARVGYYASWWIRSYILKYLLDNFRLVKVGTTQAQKKLFYHLMREKERLEAQGLLAGPKLLAEKLQVREKDVIEMEQRLGSQGSEMPLDAPVERADGSKRTRMDSLADDREGADDRLAHQQLLEQLQGYLPEFEKQLNERERRLLHDRLLAEEPRTLQEVADLYGLTRERARQIEAQIIRKLREFLQRAKMVD